VGRPQLAKVSQSHWIQVHQFWAVIPIQGIRAQCGPFRSDKGHKLKIEWDIEWEGKDISAELQREEIGRRASQIALLGEVREEVNNVLRFVAEGGNYVIEGRT